MNNISYWLNKNNMEELDITDFKNIIKYHLKIMGLDEKLHKIKFELLKTLNNNIYPILKKTDDKIDYPVLTCMVFLSDYEFPFVITNIDVDDYKYKEFNKQENINVFFPKKIHMWCLMEIYVMVLSYQKHINVVTKQQKQY
jgi:hypothetical protein